MAGFNKHTSYTRSTSSLNILMDKITEVVDEKGCKVYKMIYRDVEITFPFYPYKSQAAIMDLIIDACNKAEHCLIESPTGSGKTLALLVGSIEWLKAHKKKLNEEKIVQNGPEEIGCLKEACINQDTKESLNKLIVPLLNNSKPKIMNNTNKTIQQKDDNRLSNAGTSAESLDAKGCCGTVIGICTDEEDIQNCKRKSDIADYKTITKDVASKKAELADKNVWDQPSCSYLADQPKNIKIKDSSFYGQPKQISNTSLTPTDVKNESNTYSNVIFMEDTMTDVLDSSLSECLDIFEENSPIKKENINNDFTEITSIKEEKLVDNFMNPKKKIRNNDYNNKIDTDEANLNKKEKKVRRIKSFNKIKDSIIDMDLDVFKTPKRVKQFQEKEVKKKEAANVTDKKSASEQPKEKQSRQTESEIKTYVNELFNATSIKETDVHVQKKKNIKYPKIYYATRTHSQIKQVVDQLRLSGNKDIRMTVLSSRDQTCVHPQISKLNLAEKNDQCSRLNSTKLTRNTKLCKFNSSKDNIFSRHQYLEQTGCPDIWDIEDIVKYGKMYTACPYYGVRNLVATADIIFCPYNYILSPIIRKSMDIKLKGNIIIFDEAHNIEDCCRESVSYTLKDFFLEITIQELMHLESCDANILHKYLDKIKKWMNWESENLPKGKDYNNKESIMTVTQFIARAELHGFASEAFEKFENFYWENIEDLSAVLNSNSKTCIESLLLVLKFTFNMQYIYDFAIVVESNHEDVETDMEYQATPVNRRKRNFNKKWVTNVKFICLNAACVFNVIRDESRSIVLTSGTLTPLDSFEYELGTNFLHKVELSNDITSNQLFAAGISIGPNRQQLLLNYQNIQTYAVQDDLGKLLLFIAQTVPGGVLVFFPSYSAKKSLCDRWKTTGVLGWISNHKSLFEEPKTSNEMKSVMDDYCAANSSTGTNSGGVMFAIFRGKLSEGINFENEYARAVVALGIPFPNLKAVEIRLKRNYNDRYSKLSGDEWYNIQGFRALNQALGRVIRHKDDWGIILLVDIRFKQERHRNRLSKWVRDNINSDSNIFPALKKFCNNKEAQKDQRPT